MPQELRRQFEGLTACVLIGIMKQSGHMSYQRCTRKYLFMTFVLMIVICAFGYTMKVNWIQEYETVSFRKRIPEYSRFQGNQIDGMYPKTSNPRTLTELMVDKDASPEFTFLANVTVNRRSMSNYYIHGLKSARMADYSRCNIAFVHLHKAGGSTTKKKLRQVCRQTGMASVSMSHRNTTEVYDRSLQEGNTSKPTIFWGGFSFGICDFLHGRPCSYVAVLRDPYDRIISAYFFCHIGHPPLCGPVKAKDPGVSITAWAIHQGSHFFNQLLVHIDTCRDLDLHYDEYVKPYQEHTEHIIKYATKYNDRVCWFRQKAIHKELLTPDQRRALLLYILDHLDQWFAVIGLLEEYQLSLELFREAYHRPFRTDDTTQINEGKVRNRTESNAIEKLKEELLNSEAVREALYEDIMIYEKAKEIFELQKREFYRLDQLKTISSNRKN